MEEILENEWKTVSVHKDVYNLMKDKQKELIKENKGKHVQLSYVAENAILEGISKVTL